MLSRRHRETTLMESMDLLNEELKWLRGARGNSVGSQAEVEMLREMVNEQRAKIKVRRAALLRSCACIVWCALSMSADSRARTVTRRSLRSRGRFAQ